MWLKSHLICLIFIANVMLHRPEDLSDKFTRTRRKHASPPRPPHSVEHENHPLLNKI